jgi:dissimilatory sulfite reductase related protein
MSTRNIGGLAVEVDADGHLTDRSVWNEALARALALEEGIEHLTERHWLVIRFMQETFAAKGEAPTIRKLTTESGVDTRELYALFPKGPAKKAARIAGLPKPRGCI